MKEDVIRDLRKALSPLPNGATDEEILKKTEGTLLRLSCEFRNLIREIRELFKLIIERANW